MTIIITREFWNWKLDFHIFVDTDNITSITEREQLTGYVRARANHGLSKP